MRLHQQARKVNKNSEGAFPKIVQIFIRVGSAEGIGLTFHGYVQIKNSQSIYRQEERQKHSEFPAEREKSKNAGAE